MARRSIRVTTSKLEAAIGRLALVAGALSVALFLPLSPVSAQDSGKPVQLGPKAAPAKPAKPKPTAPEKAADKPADKAAAQQMPEDLYPWIKICQKDTEGKSVCLIAKELRSAEGQLIASVAMRDTEGEPKKTLLIAIPPAVLIQPGMRVMIDKAKPEEVKYRICFPNACYADLDLSDQMEKALAKGTVLIVTALNLQQKPTGYPFRLDTFKAALEGPGVDPAGAQQSQDQLQQELQKRAEEAAKKLQAAQPVKP